MSFYIDSSSPENSKLLLETQKNMSKKLKNVDRTIFIFVKDPNFKPENFVMGSDTPKNFILVNDNNRSSDLVAISIFPYTLILNSNHNLIGKVAGYQSWDTQDKVQFMDNLIR